MRVAEITTRIVRVIEVPRSQLADFLNMPEAQQVGVYFLMGEFGSDPNARAIFGVVRHRRDHQGRALQPGKRQHRHAALHLRAAASRMPRDPRGADGVGEYTAEGFVVLKGSKGRIENEASIQGTSNVQIRESLVNDGVMALQDCLYVFTRNHLFPSPSQAAMALMGRSANGWVEWKAANGRTLDELKRQAVAAVG